MRTERVVTHSALKQLKLIQREIDHLKRVNDLAVDRIGELKEKKRHLFQELEPKIRRASLQFLLVIASGLITLLVACIGITYFIGTGRWCREVVEMYHLEERLGQRSMDLKRQTFPWAVSAIMVVLVIASLGGAANPSVRLQDALRWEWPYFGIATFGTVWIAYAFRRLRKNIAENYTVIEQIVEQVKTIRRERGLDDT